VRSLFVVLKRNKHLTYKQPMEIMHEAGVLGHVVVIRKDGTDGGKFPVTDDILIGRLEDCHVRINLSTVSRRHAILRVDEEGSILLKNCSKTNPTLLNKEALWAQDERLVNDQDVICIGERYFRWERTTQQHLKEKAIAVRSPQPVLKESQQSLTTPVRDAIKARRMATPAPGATEPSHPALPTPMRKEIHSRPIVVEPVDLLKPASTPLRDAIIAKWTNFFAEKRVAESPSSPVLNNEHHQELAVSPIEVEKGYSSTEEGKFSSDTGERESYAHGMNTPCQRVLIENIDIHPNIALDESMDVDTPRQHTPKYIDSNDTPATTNAIFANTPKEECGEGRLQISPKTSSSITATPMEYGALQRMFKTPKETLSFTPVCDGIKELFVSPQAEKASAQPSPSLEVGEDVTRATEDEQLADNVDSENTITISNPGEEIEAKPARRRSSRLSSASIKPINLEEESTLFSKEESRRVSAESMSSFTPDEQPSEYERDSHRLSVSSIASSTIDEDVNEKPRRRSSRRLSTKLMESDLKETSSPVVATTTQRRRSRRISMSSNNAKDGEEEKKKPAASRRRSRRLSAASILEPSGGDSDSPPTEPSTEAETSTTTTDSSQQEEDTKFSTREEFPINMEFIMSCKKGTVIEALDFDDDEECFIFFNALVVGRPTKTKGVPIKWSDSKGNASGRTVHTKYCRPFKSTKKLLPDVIEEINEEEEQESIPDFSTLRVVDLQKELKSRGLLTRGRKAELIERLEEFYAQN
jgi:hypothetical protein